MMLGKKIALLGAFVIGTTGAAEFKVEDVIHPAVAKLGEPTIFLDDPEMFAISTLNPKAARHVKQGVALFNSPWDFEAYRHFCAAAKADPDCLMAYWGMVMSLAGNKTEFYRQRKAAVERILDLLATEPSVGVEIERVYAMAAVRLLTDGAVAAGETYLKVSEQFPADRQSKLLGNFLIRDGYDSLGKPKIRQKKVNAALQKLVMESPDDLPLLSFWVNSFSEAPPGALDLKKDALPVARKLARLKPDFPPFQLAAAHIESRCGNAKLAIGYATKARNLYATYMKDEKVSIYDCDGWIRAQLYLAHLYATKGEFEKSVPIMKELAGIKIDEGRLFSRGASLLFWEGRTLGARLYAGRKTTRDFDAALKLLNQLSKAQWFEEKSFVGNYRDGLVLYLGARKALVKKDMKAAKALHARMVERGKVMAGQRTLARETSSYSEWYRAATNLGVLASELQGLIAEQATGASKLGAVNWYQSAIEQQTLPTSLLPPSLAYPIEERLGWFYIESGKKQEALEVLAQGLKRRPNHLGTLKAYHEVLSRLGKKAEAAQVKKTIDLVLQ